MEKYLHYQGAIRPMVESAGGRYLARGGEFMVVAGDYQPHRLILVEFPSMLAMDEFFNSAAYLGLEPQRLACSAVCCFARSPIADARNRTMPRCVGD